MEAPSVPHNNRIPAVTQKLIEGADSDFISMLWKLVRLRFACLTFELTGAGIAGVRV